MHENTLKQKFSLVLRVEHVQVVPTANSCLIKLPENGVGGGVSRSKFIQESTVANHL